MQGMPDLRAGHTVFPCAIAFTPIHQSYPVADTVVSSEIYLLHHREPILHDSVYVSHAIGNRIHRTLDGRIIVLLDDRDLVVASPKLELCGLAALHHEQPLVTRPRYVSVDR